MTQVTMNTVLSQAGRALAQQAMHYAAQVPAYVAAAQQQLQQQQQPQQPQRRSSARGSEMDQTILDENAPSEDQVCVCCAVQENLSCLALHCL